jgi:hypothetical protein
MNIFLQLTLAGADTGPFDLFSDADSYTVPFYTSVAKIDLTSGYFTTAPSGTTTVRIQSVAPSLCTSFVDVVLGTPPPVDDCQCYLISSIEDPLAPLVGTTFFYNDCDDNFQSIYLNPNQVSYICSKIIPTFFPLERGLVVLEPNTTNCGGCPPSSTSTTTSTTTVVPFLSYNLYLCGTTTPAGARVPYIDPGQYVGGEIVKGSNGTCYTVSTPSIQTPTITVVSEHGSCEDCES